MSKNLGDRERSTDPTDTVTGQQSRGVKRKLIEHDEVRASYLPSRQVCCQTCTCKQAFGVNAAVVQLYPDVLDPKMAMVHRGEGLLMPLHLNTEDHQPCAHINPLLVDRKGVPSFLLVASPMLCGAED